MQAKQNNNKYKIMVVAILNMYYKTNKKYQKKIIKTKAKAKAETNRKSVEIK